MNAFSSEFQFEGKRAEFRKYLEATGATEKMTKTLMKLYQEEDRPAESLLYIVKHLSEGLPDSEEVIELKAEVKKLTQEKDKIQLELDILKTPTVEKTTSEINVELETKFKALEADETGGSLIKEYLTEEVFKKLVDLKTELNGTLLDNIQCGLTHFDAEVGVFASDQFAYETFGLLFDPVLEDIHDAEGEGDPPVPVTQPDVDWGDIEELSDLDPESLFIKSISISANRALHGVPFMPLISAEELKAATEKISKALTEITDEEFAGTYHDLSDIEQEQKTAWVEDGTLFGEADDKFLQAAGTYRFWPLARGLYVNEKKNFRAWVNEQEHLQVTAFSESGNLREVYERLKKGFELLKDLEFAKVNRWGFAAHNLKNVGNTLHFKAKAKIPQLSLPENNEKLETFSEAHQIAIKDLGKGLFELTNKKVVGITEIEAAKGFAKGIAEIITAEKCLYA